MDAGKVSRCFRDLEPVEEAKRESMGRFACSADIFAEDLAEVYENEKSFAHWDPDGEMSDEAIRKECRHQAWVALVSELYKARNTISLSSMGLLHFRYDSNAYRSNKAGIAKVMKKHGNLSEADADALVQQLIQDGVENGALTAGNAMKPSDLESIFHSETRRVLVKQREKGEETYKNGWLPSSRTNGGYYPNNRVRRVMQALGCEAKTAVRFLDFLWKKLEFTEEFAFDLKDFQLCLNAAPHVRTWRCKCDTSCYSCIRNYYNQKIHTNLLRKQAADFLRQWQDPLIPVASGEAGKEAAPVSGVVTLTDGEDAQKDFADWAEIENNYGNELSILDGMKISRAGCLTAPTVEINGEEADAVLAWEDRQILLLNEEASQGFMDVLKACGWKVFVSDSVPDELVEILKGVD